MGRPSLRNCDECKFAELSDTACRCAHGNKPVFVTPDWDAIRSGEWGWMLRCRDFSIQTRPQVQPAPSIQPHQVLGKVLQFAP